MPDYELSTQMGNYLLDNIYAWPTIGHYKVCLNEPSHILYMYLKGSTIIMRMCLMAIQWIRLVCFINVHTLDDNLWLKYVITENKSRRHKWFRWIWHWHYENQYGSQLMYHLVYNIPARIFVLLCQPFVWTLSCFMIRKPIKFLVVWMAAGEWKSF